MMLQIQWYLKCLGADRDALGRPWGTPTGEPPWRSIGLGVRPPTWYLPIPWGPASRLVAACEIIISHINAPGSIHTGGSYQQLDRPDYLSCRCQPGSFQSMLAFALRATNRVALMAELEIARGSKAGTSWLSLIQLASQLRAQPLNGRSQHWVPDLGPFLWGTCQAVD